MVFLSFFWGLCLNILPWNSFIFYSHTKKNLNTFSTSIPLLWFPTSSLCSPLNPFHWWGFLLRLLFWFIEFSFPSIVSACPSSTILCLYWIPFSCFIFTSLFQLSLCFAFLVYLSIAVTMLWMLCLKVPWILDSMTEISNFWRRHVFLSFHSVSICINIYCLQLVGEDRYGTGHDCCPICA